MCAISGKIRCGIHTKPEIASVVTWACATSAHLQGTTIGDADCLAGRVLYQQDMSLLRACAQKQTARAHVSLYELGMQVCVASGWSRSHQYQTKVSGLRSSSWWDGTTHGHAVLPACPRSSLGERVLARSLWALAQGECH